MRKGIILDDGSGTRLYPLILGSPSWLLSWPNDYGRYPARITL